VTGAGVAILVRGWNLPAWAGAFYPDDLPPEWRLPYFANAFPAVLLPAPEWLAAGPAGLAAWAAEVPARFRFYLEQPAGPADAALLAAASGSLGASLGGVVASRLPSAPVPGVPLFVPAAEAAGEAGVWAGAGRDAPTGGLRERRRWLAELAAAPGGALVVLEGDAATPGELQRWWELAWLSGLA
jgi:hypothetical protein